MSNRNPADRLSDLRLAIKKLEEEEAAIRQHLLDHAEDRVGEEYVATVGRWPQSHLNVEALERELGAGWLAGFRVVTEVQTVRLQRRPGATRAAL